MSTLTKEAKKYCLAVQENRERGDLVADLEGIGVACYDEEGNEELAEATVDSIEAGDIDFDWSFAAAKSSGHHTYMLWLDVDEVWE